jgi:hypothetical protein
MEDPAAPLPPLADELEARLAQAESALRDTKALLDRAERGRAIDAALLEAGALDLETARLVAERALERGGASATPEGVVGALRTRKPFLFRRAAPASAGGAMAARPRDDDSALAKAATDAASTGGRDALLRYLRLRRNA